MSIRQKFRLRVMDLNGNPGTICMWMRDATNWGVAYALRGQLLACIRPVESETALMQPVEVLSGLGQTGTTPTVQDVATLYFETTDALSLKVPLLGPGNIFESDDTTVDPLNAHVAAVIATVLGFAEGISGGSVSRYVAGRRVA